MKTIDRFTENIILSSGKYENELKYWQNLIDGNIQPSFFPKDNKNELISINNTSFNYQFPKKLANKLFALCNNSEYGSFIVLLTGIFFLLQRFMKKDKLMVGIPLIKGRVVHSSQNNILPVSYQLSPKETFKSFVTSVKESLIQAYENQGLPLRNIFQDRGLPLYKDEPLFRTLILMENIHEISNLNLDVPDTVFVFRWNASTLTLCVYYNEYDYKETTVKRIVQLFSDYLAEVLENPSTNLSEINIFSESDISMINSLEQQVQEIEKIEQTGSIKFVDYEAPRNTHEEIIANLFREVLGVEEVGIHHNFFSLGGDSIKAIRLTSMLLKYGIKVRIKDLYAFPTIAELFGNIEVGGYRTISQEPVSGEIRLTPIQKWYFEKKPPNPSYHNQSVFLFRKEGFDNKILSDVFKDIVKHHDALRIIFLFKHGKIKQYNQELGEQPGFEIINIDLCNEDPSLISKRVAIEATRIHSSFNISSGPLLKLVLFRTKEGDHLLIIVHHLVIDGISWRILLEDFARGYVQKLNNENIVFPEKTNSYKEWAEALHLYSKSKEVQEESIYWNNLLSKKIKPLAKENRKHQSEVIERIDFTAVFSVEETTSIKNASNKLNYSIESILLAAISLSIKQWSGIETLRFDLEGHGRQEQIDDITISRTLGWFTSIYPVIVEVNALKYLDLVYRVNNMLERVPNQGFNYSILRYLNSDSIVTGISSELCFNYLGEFDQDINTGLFTISNLPSGKSIDDRFYNPYTFDINAIIIENQLRININYNRSNFFENEVQSIVEACKKYILELTEFENFQQQELLSLPNKCIIRGVKPFNDIYYKDCFYNAFFAVLEYFGKDKCAFLANDLFVYSERNLKNPLDLEVEFISKDGIFDLANRNGIHVNTVVKSENIIDNIKLSLTKGNLAIVRVDCFYESIRKDTYYKKHWPHTLLVYGYDDVLQQLHILEHSDINALDYQQVTISYKEMVECYNGLFSNFNVGQSNPSYIEIGLKNTTYESAEFKQTLKDFAQQVQRHSEMAFERIDQLIDYTEELNKVIFIESEFIDLIEQFSFTYRNILKSKYAESYRNQQLILGEQVNKSMEEVLEIWKLVNNIVAKISLTRRFNNSTSETLKGLFTRLYDAEKKYNEELINFINRAVD